MVLRTIGTFFSSKFGNKNNRILSAVEWFRRRLFFCGVREKNLFFMYIYIYVYIWEDKMFQGSSIISYILMKKRLFFLLMKRFFFYCWRKGFYFLLEKRVLFFIEEKALLRKKQIAIIQHNIFNYKLFFG